MLLLNMQRKGSKMGCTNKCELNLLKRIISENPNLKKHKISSTHLNKIKSALIFNTLIKHNLVDGYTNIKVYNTYCEIAKTISVPVISKIDFSRTLCKYYGFKLSSIKKNGKTKRIFLKDITPTKTEQIHAFQALGCYLMNIKTKEDFLGQRNLDAYEKYVDWCRDNIQPIANKIVFSRTVCASYNISMKSAKKDEKTIRVYVELDGDDNADNSSNQESLG